MTADEVQFVLDAIDSNVAGFGNSGFGAFGYGHSDLSDIPLERIDRDNSEVLEGGLHSHSESLEAMNYVGAQVADRNPSPIGTEYDHDLEVIVGVRIEGAHEQENGAIDPKRGTADEATHPNWPTAQWDDLVQGIRAALSRERSYPSVGRANVSYTDLRLTNEADASSDYADYFRYDLDVVLNGFETLP